MRNQVHAMLVSVARMDGLSETQADAKANRYLDAAIALMAERVRGVGRHNFHAYSAACQVVYVWFKDQA